MNKKDTNSLVVYGRAVTGGEWKSMKLVEKEVDIDINSHYVNDLSKILYIRAMKSYARDSIF